MYTRTYEITRIPDLTLSKYSALDENGVEGVMLKELSFLRQIYREALLANETIHWIYSYSPTEKKGKRLKIFLKFDCQRLSDYADTFVKNSPLSPYFDISSANLDLQYHAFFDFMAVLIKREKISMASRSEHGYFYSVNKWEMNENSRLFNLFNIMKNINQPCIYCVDVQAVDFTNLIETPEMLGNAMAALREMLALRFDKNNLGTSLQKDEHADYTLNNYKDLVKDLAANPHFLANIRAYSNSSEYSCMMLDAAASEALDEGSHDIVVQTGAFDIKTIVESKVASFCDKKAPEELKFLSTLFVMKELAPFVSLPALYPGESIEIPKETAPNYDEHGLYLGQDNDGYNVYIPLENLPKHAFLAGMPGSGKTNSMLHIATELYTKGIPFLILEPAKQEYRALINREDMRGVTVFSPSAGTKFLLHINPFEFPLKMSLAEHIRNLINVFDGAFAMDPPMPFLLDSAIERVYRNKGWLPYMINDGNIIYPTMSELYKTLESILDETEYEGEVKGNLKSILQVRIGSLLSREMGDVFDVPYSTIAPEEWLKRSVVIELESMGSGPANFLTLMLATLIRESLKVNPMTRQEAKTKPVRHVIFFEEAHNLIGPHTEIEGKDVADPKLAATAFIVKMLAEVRALNEVIIIADQLPTAMAPEVIKNTSLKLGHRITSLDDKGLLGSTMLADEVQLERMSSFTQGKALAIYEGLLKPFEIQIHQWSNIDGIINDNLYTSPSDDELYRALFYEGSQFINDVEKSYRITSWKADVKWDEITHDISEFEELLNLAIDFSAEIQESRERLTHVNWSKVPQDKIDELNAKISRSVADYEARLDELRKIFHSLCDRMEEILFTLNAYKHQNSCFEKKINAFVIMKLRQYRAFLVAVKELADFQRTPEQMERCLRLLGQ